MLLVVGIQYLTKVLRLYICNSGRIYNHRYMNRRMLALEKPVWRKTTRLTSISSGFGNFKGWRDKGRGSFCPPHSRRQKEAPLAGWCAQQMNSYCWNLARHSRFLVENQSTAAFFHLTRDWEFVSHWRRTACLGNKNRLCVRNQSNVKLRGLFLLETENLFPIDVGRRACLRNKNCLCVGNQSNDELKEVCLC